MASRILPQSAFGRSKLGQYFSPQGRSQSYSDPKEDPVQEDEDVKRDIIFGALDEDGFADLDDIKDESEITNSELMQFGYTQDKFKSLQENVKKALELIIKDQRKTIPKKAKPVKSQATQTKLSAVQNNKKTPNSKIMRGKNTVVTDIF